MALHINAGEGDMLSERICGTAFVPPGRDALLARAKQIENGRLDIGGL